MTLEFDPEPLAQLSQDLDVDAAREIIASYLEEAPQLVRDAHRALTSGDLHGFQRAVHTLKSISAHVGARRLSEAARALEVAARRGEAPRAAALSELQDQLDKVRQRLSDWRS